MAGSYVFQLSASDPGGSSSVTTGKIIVSPALTSLAVTPSTITLAYGAQEQFTASAADQFGNAMAPPTQLSWTLSGGGAIDANTGIYTAPASGSGGTVTVASGGVISSAATVSLSTSGGSGTDTGPTIVNQPSASPAMVNGISTTLSVLGADVAGEPTLTYTWSAVGAVPAPPSFSDNGNNAAHSVSVSFKESGTYVFEVTITNEEQQSISGTPVTVTVTGVTTVTPTISVSAPASTEVDLTWPVSSDPNLETYQVYRGTSPSFSPSDDTMISSDTPVNFFLDTGLAPGTTYYYKVAVLSTSLVSTPYSTSSGITTPMADSAPAQQPTDLNCDPTSDSQVTLYWQDAGTNTCSDVIQISNDGGNTWTTLDTVPAHSDSYIATGLTQNTSYTFQVTAENNYVVSSSSAGETAAAATTPSGTRVNTRTASSGVIDTVIYVIAGHLQHAADAFASGTGKLYPIVNGLQQKYGDHVLVLPGVEYENLKVVSQIESSMAQYMQSGVLNFGMVGYSHGGGVEYDVSQDFASLAAANAPGNIFTAPITTPQLLYTAYIDAIVRPSNSDPNNILGPAVTKRPVGAIVNDNFHDNLVKGFLNGQPTSDFNASTDHDYPEPIEKGGILANNPITHGEMPVTHVDIETLPVVASAILTGFGNAYDEYGYQYIV